MPEVETSMRSFVRGYARVPLRELRFDTGRQEDARITKRLTKIFESPRGCQNQDPVNLISVVLTGDVDLPLSESINDAPLLDARHRQAVVCLHGRHRVLAAQNTLAARDRWWVAEVYDHRECTIVRSVVL